MGDLLKIAAPIASFLPGAGPAIGAGLGALTTVREGNKARKQADRYRGEQEGIIRQQQDYLEKYLLPALNSFMTNVGFNPATGEFGGDALEPYKNVPNPFKASYSSLVNQFAEPRDVAADQQVNQLIQDFRRTGFQGGAGLDSAIANIRNSARSDVSAFLRDLGVRSNEFESERAMNNINESMRRMLAVADAAQAGIGAIGGPLGSIGGLGNMAASRQNAAAQSLTGLIGTAASAGLFGGKKRPADAGDNRLGTNQAPTPIGGFPSLYSPEELQGMIKDVVPNGYRLPDGSYLPALSYGKRRSRFA